MAASLPTTVLPAQRRLTDAAGFALARTGRRGGSRALVVQVAEGADGAPARVGLIVGKAVGGAVVRNRVKRRLRHLLRARLGCLPVGAVVSVRALAPAAAMDSAELARQLERCLSRAGLDVERPDEAVVVR